MKQFLFALTFTLCCVASTELQAENKLQEITDHINESRYALGQQQLLFDDSLMAPAFHHAKDMAIREYFSHITPEGWSVLTRAIGWGWPQWQPVGEVLACGTDDPWQVFVGWMNSPSHEELLHNGNFNRMGVAHYYNENESCQHYWVVVLGQFTEG